MPDQIFLSGNLVIMVAYAAVTVSIAVPLARAGQVRIYVDPWGQHRLDEAGARECAARDVAEAQRATLATVVEHTDDAVIGVTPEGIITAWNGGAERVFGYPAGEVLGRPATMLADESGSGEQADVLERVRRGERGLAYETRRLRALTVHADPGQIQQVLLNLAINARDAMPDGGTPVLEANHAELDGDEVDMQPPLPAGTYARLLVGDTGAGMSPETAARIFEPFHTTEPQGRGTGLGLATVYGIDVPDLPAGGGHPGRPAGGPARHRRVTAAELRRKRASVCERAAAGVPSPRS
jgi:PAS domain S-box-containing protein